MGSLLQGVPEKTHKVSHVINFQPLTTESQYFHQNT